jgi:hypothetical protein
MTDEQSPAPESRRARLATRRQRLRFVGLILAAVLIVVGVGTATALHGTDDAPITSSGSKAAGTTDPTTTLGLGLTRDVDPPRKLSHDDPLKLWIGGDSLAGSFGPALGQIAGATGVVDATIDYKVSSGLEDDGIRDWYEHAQEAMASENPDAVVFIIGTNDASIVSTYDGNHDGVPDWEPGYREKVDRMMATLVGGSRHRTVYWLGPPTLGDETLDKGAKAMGPLMREEAKKFPDVVYVDTYRLFSGPDGGYSRDLPDAHGDDVEMRISDGVHFTVDGAQYLSDAVWKLLNRRWQITKQADPSQPIEYTIAPGSNYYVPGVGHYHPSVSSGSSSGSDSGSSSDSGSGSSSETTTPSSVGAGGSGATGTPTSLGSTKSTTPPTLGSTKPTTTSPATTPPTTPHTSPPTSPPAKPPTPKKPAETPTT